jgi:hypothetical protein
MQNREESQQTGTKNETYNVISIMYHALQGAENCQTYLNDAQDGQTREFFQQALQSQRQLADRGKEVLQQVLQQDTGGSSAFGWGQSQSPNEFQSSQSGSAGQGESAFGSSSQSQSGSSGQSFESQGSGQTTGGGNF